MLACCGSMLQNARAGERGKPPAHRPKSVQQATGRQFQDHPNQAGLGSNGKGRQRQRGLYAQRDCGTRNKAAVCQWQRSRVGRAVVSPETATHQLPNDAPKHSYKTGCASDEDNRQVPSPIRFSPRKPKATGRQFSATREVGTATRCITLMRPASAVAGTDEASSQSASSPRKPKATGDFFRRCHVPDQFTVSADIHRVTCRRDVFPSLRQNEQHTTALADEPGGKRNAVGQGACTFIPHLVLSDPISAAAVDTRGVGHVWWGTLSQ